MDHHYQTKRYVTVEIADFLPQRSPYGEYIKRYTTGWVDLGDLITRYVIDFFFISFIHCMCYAAPIAASDERAYIDELDVDFTMLFDDLEDWDIPDELLEIIHTELKYRGITTTTVARDLLSFIDQGILVNYLTKLRLHITNQLTGVIFSTDTVTEVIISRNECYAVLTIESN